MQCGRYVLDLWVRKMFWRMEFSSILAWRILWREQPVIIQPHTSSVQFSSVQSLSHVWLFATPWIAARQASLSITKLLEFTQIHVYRVTYVIQLSHPMSSPSLPAPNPSQHESFTMSQLFTWGGQSTEVSALASFLPKIPGWSPSEWTGWISLQSKGLSRVLSNTTVQKHQFFGTQPSSQSNSHIHTWLLEKL